MPQRDYVTINQLWLLAPRVALRLTLPDPPPQVASGFALGK